MSAAKTLGFVFLLVVLLVFFGSVYTVQEGQNGIVLKLGDIVKNHAGQVEIKRPGLHFKVPFIEEARRFDMRLQTMSVESSRILTAEQKYVLVDYYAKWRIADVSLFYTRTGGSTEQAETLLEQKINDALRAAFGQHTITEVISAERGAIMGSVKGAASDSAKDLGIQVIDVRIKRIDLPKEVSDSVFQRMRAEREQVANQHRSDGQAQAETIRAKADATVTVTLAKAKEQAAQIRSLGLAQAAQIYAQAYGKDPDFYAFFRSMDAYRQSFSSKNDILVLQPSNEFFKFFNAANGVKATIATSQKSTTTH